MGCRHFVSMAWYKGGCERGVKKGGMKGRNKYMSGDATNLLRKLVGFVVTIASAMQYSTETHTWPVVSGTDREIKSIYVLG